MSRLTDGLNYNNSAGLDQPPVTEMPPSSDDLNGRGPRPVELRHPARLYVVDLQGVDLIPKDRPPHVALRYAF